jgi:hypothetical protein
MLMAIAIANFLLAQHPTTPLWLKELEPLWRATTSGHRVSNAEVSADGQANLGDLHRRILLSDQGSRSDVLTESYIRKSFPKSAYKGSKLHIQCIPSLCEIASLYKAERRSTDLFIKDYNSFLSKICTSLKGRCTIAVNDSNSSRLGAILLSYVSY